jgi:cytochrome bd-type quinol oxidase subunit 2
MTETINNGVTSFRVHVPPADHPENTPAEPQANDDLPEADRTQETRSTNLTRRPHPWPLFIIGLAAAVAVWSGWVGLGQMAGFGIIHPLPGIWDRLKINTAVVLPLSVEAYAAYALRIWLGTNATRHPRTTKFAKRSAIASLVIGAAAQVAYHLMEAAGRKQAPWPIVMLVAVIPVIVLGFASALAKLVTSDDTRAEN